MTSHSPSPAAGAAETPSTKTHGGPTAFRYRGLEMARIDAFSDVVFGFALTLLLVVSLEVPRTFSELMQAMHGFLAFALCFTMLILVWYEHYKFFKRYALHDVWTLTLNAALLFVVMFYVYPLKFLVTVLVKVFTGAPLTIEGPHGPESVIAIGDLRTLMAIYGAGFSAVYLLFAQMYGHALRQRAQLELNEFEELDTRESLTEHYAMVAIGLLSVSVAAADGRLAGMVYWLIPIMHTVLGIRYGKRRRALAARVRSATAGG